MRAGANSSTELHPSKRPRDKTKGQVQQETKRVHHNVDRALAPLQLRRHPGPAFLVQRTSIPCLDDKRTFVVTGCVISQNGLGYTLGQSRQ